MTQYLLVLVWTATMTWTTGTASTATNGVVWSQPVIERQSEVALPYRFRSLARCAKAGYLAVHTPGNTEIPSGFLCVRAG